MGVLIDALARAKVSSLGGKLPWTSGSLLKRPSTNGEKRTHQLDTISRTCWVSCPEGFGLRLEDGKKIDGQIQKAILNDQIEEVTRESRVCPTCASVRAIHDYRSRVLNTLFGRVRVKTVPLFLRCQVNGVPSRADFAAI